MRCEPREAKSAVENMTVADVRKSLNRVRSAWKRHGPSTPLDLSERLIQDMSMERFSYLFVLGQHVKRWHKSGQHKNGKHPGQQRQRARQEQEKGK